MAERRVTQIVPQRNGLGELLVQLQHLRDGPRNLRHLQRVRQARAVVIAGGREEHLRLVLQPPERLAVDDAIAIVLERRAARRLRARRAGARASRRSWRPAAPESAARAPRDVYECSPSILVSSSQYRRQKALAVLSSDPRRSSSAMVWPRSANVRRVPRSTPVFTARPVDQQRHVLARMVGARRRRIVAVIRRDDQQVVRRAAAAAAPPAARRTARGWRHSPPHRCDGRTACRNRRDSRR